ncbi:hypothetical protein L596_021744 [Steinernema carpocapsae]|uniref:Uncharacterized protein n=1 Tax=Steinernema carpocapsae TaxID=34508 RepID=A0A4U5MJP1_STECR|nr:hypothetical protein L596_021744 [Steinernema carpocapsae]
MRARSAFSLERCEARRAEAVSRNYETAKPPSKARSAFFLGVGGEAVEAGRGREALSFLEQLRATTRRRSRREGAKGPVTCRNEVTSG